MDESLELRLSLIVCLGLSGVYVAYALLAEPAGGQPFGHWLGILGTLAMVATETLYSVRKRTTWLRWAGPVRYWLSAHIFTGIVGPFLVLMHTAFQFRGLAGLTLALTVLVAASGFVGRYLYTAIPHSLAGVEGSAADLLGAVAAAQTQLEAAARRFAPPVQAFVLAEAAQTRQPRRDWALVALRGWDTWRYRARVRAQLRRLAAPGEQPPLRELEALLRLRREREQQVHMLNAARRMLSVWHTAHVPMGVALFGSVAIHVGATLYFGAGLWR